MNTEKRMIEISGIREIRGGRVQVILQDTGQDIWLPISQAERFGNRVFIPDWLFKRYKVLREKPVS